MHKLQPCGLQISGLHAFEGTGDGLGWIFLFLFLPLDPSEVIVELFLIPSDLHILRDFGNCHIYFEALHEFSVPQKDELLYVNEADLHKSKFFPDWYVCVRGWFTPVP